MCSGVVGMVSSFSGLYVCVYCVCIYCVYILSTQHYDPESLPVHLDKDLAHLTGGHFDFDVDDKL